MNMNLSRSHLTQLVSCVVMCFSLFLPLSVQAASAPYDCSIPTEQTTMIYFANGVSNALDDAVQSTVTMEEAWRERLTQEYPSELFEFCTLYNYRANFFADVQEVLLQRIREDGVDLPAASFFVIWGLIRAGADAAEITRALGQLQIDVVTEDLESALSSFSDTISSDTLGFIQTQELETRQEFTRQLEDTLQSGNRVIVVAHSQGNLFATASISEVSERNPEYADSIHMVGVASPVAPANALPLSQSRHITAEDDFIIGTLSLFTGGNVLAMDFDNDPGFFETLVRFFGARRSIIQHEFVQDYFQIYGEFDSVNYNRTRTWIDGRIFGDQTEFGEEFDLQIGLLESMPYPDISVALPLSPPTELVASAGSEPGAIRLDWQMALGGTAPIEYRVYDATDPSALSFLETTASTNFEISDLVQFEERCYVIAAVDSLGNQSDVSDQACANPAREPTLPVATEGWLSFTSGDPGIPNDGVEVLGERCPSLSCGDRNYTLTERITRRPNGDPITISVFPLRFDMIFRVRLDGYPEYCSSGLSSTALPPDAPPFDGITGKYEVLTDGLFVEAIDRAISRYEECNSAPRSAGYIYRIDLNNAGEPIDAAYLGFGADALPEDDRPPIEMAPGWVDFSQGVAGVPDDGVLVEGDPGHSVIDQIALGSAAGLTISIYGSAGQALDSLTIRHAGYPDVCEYTLALQGALPEAPSIRGVEGKFLSLNRSQISGFTRIAEVLEPASCSGISVNDAYYAEFELFGSDKRVDGVFIQTGLDAVPDPVL